MYVAIDTNVLAYAEGINGGPMQASARSIVDQLAPESTLLPVQALGELYALLIRKGGRSRTQARDAILRWGDTFPLIETSSPVLLQAMELSVGHQLGLWDALILAAAADAGCRLLLSEDLQDGFTWSGVTVVNPFSASPHPLLGALLSPNIS
ncbi:MAG: VapC toxin family domain ribonuclease [Acidobacteria bacterium]|nr:VapC toxin family domain ribonuclease [Acidobacteriota bacterium]